MEHEVTQGEWRALMGSVPHGLAAKGYLVPVAGVSWCDAVVFSNLLTAEANKAGWGLTEAYRLPAGLEAGLDAPTCNTLALEVAPVPGATGFRLPTAGEWRWLAAGAKDPPFTYSGGNEATEVGWVNNNSRNRPHDVCTARTPRNGYGLCDLTGNVSEWVWDANERDYSAKVALRDGEPLSRAESLERWATESSWKSTTTEAELPHSFVFLGDHPPGEAALDLGFRLVRSLP